MEKIEAEALALSVGGPVEPNRECKSHGSGVFKENFECRCTLLVLDKKLGEPE